MHKLKRQQEAKKTLKAFLSKNFRIKASAHELNKLSPYAYHCTSGIRSSTPYQCIKIHIRLLCSALLWFEYRYCTNKKLAFDRHKTRWRRGEALRWTAEEIMFKKHWSLSGFWFALYKKHRFTDLSLTFVYSKASYESLHHIWTLTELVNFIIKVHTP